MRSPSIPMVKTKNQTKENLGVQQQASDEVVTDVFENLHIEQDRWRNDCTL
jgi:hypothetical protein